MRYVIIALFALAFHAPLAGRSVAAASKTDPYFAKAPELKLTRSEPLAVVSVVSPTLFAPATGGKGHSFYVFGIGQLTEIRLDSGEVVRHAVPFDRKSDALYDAGANTAWLGPDLKIYFGMQGKPARVGRFDPATGKMELLGALPGHALMRNYLGPDDRYYVITYPATLSTIDVKTGTISTYGRLADDALYVWGKIWMGEDGWLYCTPGQRPQRKVGVNVKTGEIKLLDEFPKVKEAQSPAVDFPDCAKLYAVKVDADGAQATVTFGPKGAKARKTAQFDCSTAQRDLESITVGPDGQVYACGSYNFVVFDPKTKTGRKLPVIYNVYDFVSVGSKLYFGGYPNARVGVFDTAKPWHYGSRKQIWYYRKPEFNPREILNIHELKDTSDPAHATLKMKRTWTLAVGADGMVYCGNSATRQNRGGALVILDPRTDKPVASLRKPFELLGISALCEIDGGKTLGIVTWLSPDPQRPGAEPAAARLFLYDVKTRAITCEAAPLPDCKVLVAVCQAPGTRVLVGIGLRGLTPTPEADDAFYGNGEVFFWDMDKKQLLKRQAFDFPLNLRTGRPIVPAPDGSLWISGGGGLLRVDAKSLTITPVARCGASGDFVFVGDTLYMTGSASILYADVSRLLKAKRR